MPQVGEMLGNLFPDIVIKGTAQKENEAQQFMQRIEERQEKMNRLLEFTERAQSKLATGASKIDFASGEEQSLMAQLQELYPSCFEHGITSWSSTNARYLLKSIGDRVKQESDEIAPLQTQIIETFKERERLIEECKKLLEALTGLLDRILRNTRV